MKVSLGEMPQGPRGPVPSSHAGRSGRARADGRISVRGQAERKGLPPAPTRMPPEGAGLGAASPAQKDS